MEGGGLGQSPPWTFLLYIFLTMKMTFNLNEFWHGVRQYQGEFVKKNSSQQNRRQCHGDVINITQNDGMFRILKNWPIFLTMKMTFNLNKFLHGVRQYQGQFLKKFMTIQSKSTSQYCHLILTLTVEQ